MCIVTKTVETPKYLKKTDYFSVVDIGSTNICFTRYKITGQVIEAIGYSKSQPRLAALINDEKKLDLSIAGRIAEILLKFRISRSYQDYYVFGTSAIREAKNWREIVSLVYKKTNLTIHVLSGLEEARLVFKSILHDIPSKNKLILGLDIGGGSTELILGNEKDLHFLHSFQFGCLSLLKCFRVEKKCSHEKLKNIEFYLKSSLKRFKKDYKNFLKDILCVATSGTVRTIKSIATAHKVLPLEKTNLLSKKEIDAVYKLVTKDSVHMNRKQLPGLRHSSPDIVFSGTIILKVITDVFKLETWQISNYTVREGAALAHYKDLRRLSYMSLKKTIFKHFPKRLRHFEESMNLEKKLYPFYHPFIGCITHANFSFQLFLSYRIALSLYFYFSEHLQKKLSRRVLEVTLEELLITGVSLNEIDNIYILLKAFRVGFFDENLADRYFKSQDDKKDLKALYMMFKTMEPVSNHIYKYKGVQYTTKTKVLRIRYFSSNNGKLVVNPYPLDYLNNYFSIKIRLSQYISTFKT